VIQDMEDSNEIIIIVNVILTGEMAETPPGWGWPRHAVQRDGAGMVQEPGRTYAFPHHLIIGEHNQGCI